MLDDVERRAREQMDRMQGIADEAQKVMSAFAEMGEAGIRCSAPAPKNPNSENGNS